MTKNPEYCTTHSAYIYDRGGMQRLGQLGQITKVGWGRVRDDISFGEVTIAEPSVECQALLAQVRANRHELVIYEGEERRWEGPISLVSLTETGGTIEARDVMYYVFRTASRAGRKSVPSETVIERSVALLQQLSRKEALYPPVNVLPYVRTFTTPNDARTAKRTRPYETTVFDDIDSLAQYSGMDYTVLGRSIMLFDTHTRWAVTPPVTQADFLADIIISEYGMQGATHAYSTSFEGLIGQAADNGNDPYYGEWEVIDSAYNEEGTTAPTQAALNSQADRNLAGKNPVPIYVRVPQNATLSPDSALTTDVLVPGIRIPLRAHRLGRDFDTVQKLDTMKVTETGGLTKVQVTMSPASLNDEEAVTS